MTDIAQKGENIRILRMDLDDEIENISDLDSFFRKATKLEELMRQLGTLVIHALGNDYADEMNLALKAEFESVSRVQATLRSKVHLVMCFVQGGLIVVGGGFAAKGSLMKASAAGNAVLKAAANGVIQKGKFISGLAKLSELASTVVDRSNEAERAGHQHEQKVAGQFSDSFRQALNEMKQNERRYDQLESEAERNRHQGVVSPAA